MNLFDAAYGLGVGVTAPVWLVVPKARRKVMEAWRNRRAKEPGRQTSHPAVMIHAVSNGELNATTAMLAMLEQARPELRFVVSTTTLTGYEQAQKLYGANPRVNIVRFPLDLSGAVSRLLDAQRPAAVVLMELEVWPNFVAACARHEIPVLIFNGRLTTGSYRGYRLGWPITRPTFRRLTYVCAQEETYATRFTKLGVLPDRVRVTGTMKFDSAQITDRIAGADALAAEVGLQPGKETIWVCGSTGPGEDEIVLDAYARLLEKFPRLRLVIVPRKQDRFDEVAELIRSCGHRLVRRSQNSGATSKRVITQEPTTTTSQAPPVVLGDTFGELRKFYSVADVVFVGRTLVDLGRKQHGSDMIEPAALGKPVVVGPFTRNFAEPMNRFREASAVVEILPDKEHLPVDLLQQAVAGLLENAKKAGEMGVAAQEVVRANQGATARNVETLLTYLVSPVVTRAG